MSQRQPHPGERPAFVLSNPAGLYDPVPNGYSHLAALRPGARLVLQGAIVNTGLALLSSGALLVLLATVLAPSVDVASRMRPF